MEQVVPNKEMGKPVVSPSKVAFIRKWASPPNQSALIQTYRCALLSFLGSWDGKGPVSTQSISLCDWKTSPTATEA